MTLNLVPMYLPVGKIPSLTSSKNVCFEIKKSASASEGIPVFQWVGAGDGEFLPLAGNNNCLMLTSFAAYVCAQVF